MRLNSKRSRSTAAYKLRLISPSQSQRQTTVQLGSSPKRTRAQPSEWPGTRRYQVKNCTYTGSMKRDSSRISHGIRASGIGEPTHLWETRHSLATWPKEATSNTRKTTYHSNMQTFLQGLNLRNTTTAQMTRRFWHNARPRKVGTLIWLTLNQGLPVGTWLQLMGIDPLCKICDLNTEESPQHCLLECSMAQRA
jgi:hypothetical protein